jgi:tRNA-binding protein
MDNSALRRSVVAAMAVSADQLYSVPFAGTVCGRDLKDPAMEPAMSDKPTITYDDFARLDLRVATITAAEPHPNADRLLKLQIDLGGETRQICAGIRQYYDGAALVGRQIVVLANLQPRTIRGEASNGMLLAASVSDPSSSDGNMPAGAAVSDVVLLSLDRPAPPGSRVG